MSNNSIVSGRTEVASRSTGCGGPWKEYDSIVGCIIINEFDADSLHNICLYTACSSGEELKLCRNFDRRRWNMNCGYILNSGGRRKLVGSSFLYVPNLAAIRISDRSSHLMTSARSSLSHRCIANRAINTAAAS